MQNNLQIQCSPNQVTKGILHRTRPKKKLNLYTQRTPNRQSNLEKEKYRHLLHAAVIKEAGLHFQALRVCAGEQLCSVWLVVLITCGTKLSMYGIWKPCS